MEISNIKKDIVNYVVKYVLNKQGKVQITNIRFIGNK